MTSKNESGLNQFHTWHTAISEIYRCYMIQQPNEERTIYPIIPRSERGNICLHLQVTNDTKNVMRAYWVDYLGREIDKGSCLPGQTWYQTTWIGHPWSFRFENSSAKNAAVYFVPFRIIQHTDRVPTMDSNDKVGIHRFSIRCGLNDVLEINDPVFPFPSTRLHSAENAFIWSLRHMEREDSSPETLLKYLRNLCAHPENEKYRKIRTANKTFWNYVWINSSRGMLHALGFIEDGAYIILRDNVSENIQKCRQAIYELEKWLSEQSGQQSTPSEQPNGSRDGFGRAGFGRAGATN